MKKMIFLVITILLVILIYKIKPAKFIFNTQKGYNNITYNILATDDLNSVYKERGYYITEKDNKVLITIAAGMKNTGGFAIKINDIKINNKNVKIYIKETEPPKDSNVIQVINYPIVQVELNEKPESLLIKNIDDNSIYSKVN